MSLAEALTSISPMDEVVDFSSVLATRAEEVKAVQARHLNHDTPNMLRAAIMLLGNLVLLGWRLEKEANRLYIHPLLPESYSSAVQKNIVQSQERYQRDKMLAGQKEWIQKMEESGKTKKSIKTIICDGEALWENLKEHDFSLAAIQPYVQLAVDKERCPFTNHLLLDIWRYFRYTWSSKHATGARRELKFIVRDAGMKNHPVIGIFELSSVPAGMTLRDNKAGWSKAETIRLLRALPQERRYAWALEATNRALLECYWQDLILEGIVPSKALSGNPAALPAPEEREALLVRIKSEAQREKDRWTNLPAQEKKRTTTSWIQSSDTALSREKRLHYFTKAIALRWSILDSMGRGEELSEEDIFSARKIYYDAMIGDGLADISCCGAVAPYNHIVGGKLVCLLAVSPAATKAWKNRYKDRPVEISSARARGPIYRPSNLALFTTTSLYGGGDEGERPNQYSNIHVPLNEKDSFSYCYLGKSSSTGTAQFDEAVYQAMLDTLPEDSRINNIYGEGTSPKMRAISSALGILGWPKTLLEHKRRRSVYYVQTVHNVTAYLLQLEKTPQWILDQDEGTTHLIEHWRKCYAWRLRRKKHATRVEAGMRQESLESGIHGALPVIPREEKAESQYSLF